MKRGRIRSEEKVVALLLEESLLETMSELLCSLYQLGRLVTDGRCRDLIILVNGKPFSGKSWFIRYLQSVLGRQDKTEVSVLSISKELEQLLTGHPEEVYLRERKARGYLMPDDLVLTALLHVLDNDVRLEAFPSRIKIIDGFPRTGIQVAVLWEMIEQGLFFPDALVINLVLQASEETVWRRLAGSKVRGDRQDRSDDNPDVLSVRLDEWHRHALSYLGLAPKVCLHLDVPTDVDVVDISPEEILRTVINQSLPFVELKKQVVSKERESIQPVS